MRALPQPRDLTQTNLRLWDGLTMAYTTITHVMIGTYDRVRIVVAPVQSEKNNGIIELYEIELTSSVCYAKPPLLEKLKAMGFSPVADGCFILERDEKVLMSRQSDVVRLLRELRANPFSLKPAERKTYEKITSPKEAVLRRYERSLGVRNSDVPTGGILGRRSRREPLSAEEAASLDAQLDARIQRLKEVREDWRRMRLICRKAAIRKEVLNLLGLDATSATDLTSSGRAKSCAADTRFAEEAESCIGGSWGQSWRKKHYDSRQYAVAPSPSRPRLIVCQQAAPLPQDPAVIGAPVVHQAAPAGQTQYFRPWE